MSVLYVEDEENDVLFMRLAYRRLKLEIPLENVSDGKAAVERLSDSARPRPALVLLDLNLPRMSGFEVLAWIRAQPSLRGLPVVVFSSSGRLEDRERASALGADEYLLKPASGALFIDLLRSLQGKFLPPS